MKRALPDSRATPRPSRSSDSTIASPRRDPCAAPSPPRGRRALRAGPGIQEFAPVAPGRALERRARELALLAVHLLVAHAAQALHPEVHQVGIRRVGFAVVADALDSAVEPRAP